MGSKYLYGASVQGIQNFIFQTSKLTEIVGASELVEEICTTKFWEVAKIKKGDNNIILNAAGNIKYLFDSKEKCQSFVKIFPKKVMEMAPGITISQAVVEVKNGELNKALQTLEDKLKEQRNNVSMPFEIGFMGTDRARRTGGVAFIQRDKRKGGAEYLCEATHLKRQMSDQHYTWKKENQPESLFSKISGLNKINKKDLAFDIDKITASGKNSWIAVIHADGNGLGSILQNLNKSLENISDEKVKLAFKTFSEKIAESTEAASQHAFKIVIESIKKDAEVYSVRPIILGGDDITIIIRADLALEFTKVFLKEFEEQTKTNFKFLKDEFGIKGFENGITACAGIAYVKKSYPFHYAVDLADKLCGDAKKFVKETVGFEGLIPKSSLAFFKVQDSFIESDLKEMKKRTLRAKEVSFDYGPYLIESSDKYADVEEIKSKLEIVEKYAKKDKENKGANGISKLRQWVSESFKDETTAAFMLERMSVVNDEFYKEMKINDDRKKGKSIIYDIIQLNSLKN